MRLGLALPHYGFSFLPERDLSWNSLLETARWAEEIGLSSLWVSDHVHLDLSKYGGSDHPYRSFEYTTTLGALSISTTRAELGVLVACAALRPPAVIARSAETIASASGRTFWLGLGAGWYSPDFEAAGISFGTPAERFARLERTAGLVGEFLRPESRVRTIIGGKGGPRILATVAAAADGWNVSWAIDPASLAEKVARLTELWHENERGPGGPYISVGLTCLLAPNQAELRRRFFGMFEDFGLRLEGDPDDVFTAARRERLVCTTEELQGRLQAYHDAGASEIICGFGPVPFSMWHKDVALEFIESAIASGLVAR